MSINQHNRSITMQQPMPSNYTPVIRGSLGHRILSCMLGQEAMTAGAIKKGAQVHLNLSDLQLQKLMTLQKQGLIEPVKPDGWRLTSKGIDACLELGTPIKKTVPIRSAQAKKSEVMQRPSYTGWELGQTSTRPGAYVAYGLPSRINNTLTYRDGRTERIAS